MSAQPPQAFLNVITRQSHPQPTHPRPRHLRLESRPVTAPPGASAARPCTNPVRPGERHGTSSRGGRARERTFRATPFFAHPHHSAHHRSADAHRLRVARRQQEQQRRRHPDRRHRPRRPLTGDLSALGLGIKNSADLAVKTANKDKTVPGVKFELQALDDQAQPSVGQQNATKFIDNKGVLGIVGPLNSGVAQSMQKPLNDASLTQVSPANTGTELTQGNNWKTGDKQRPFKTYFRTATTDQIQGAFAAKYLYNDAKVKNVYLIDDQKPYG